MSECPLKQGPMCNDAAVRLAIPEDAAAISRVLQSAFGQHREHYTAAAFEVVTPPAEEIASRFSEGPQWVAELSGEVVGTVSLTHQPEGLYLRSLGVVPAAQGCGIGHRLLDATCDHAIGVGAKRIFLYTTYFVPEAIRLYETCGFKWVRDTAAEDWYGTPGLEMERSFE